MFRRVNHFYASVMKATSLFFLLLSVLLFQTISADAVSIRPGSITDYPAVLIAEKNGRVRYYSKGQAVKVWLYNGEKVRGFITLVGTDSLEISSFGNGKVNRNIAITSITGVVKLKRKERKMIGIAAAIVALLVGILAVTSKGAVFESAWGFAIVGLPAIAAGYVLVLYLGATYLLQLLNRTTIKRGWKFYKGNPAPISRGLFR